MAMNIRQLQAYGQETMRFRQLLYVVEAVRLMASANDGNSDDKRWALAILQFAKRNK